ncbi:NADP-dependent aldehyde dehydrogenase [Sphingomonas guangdongensis]|uniref:2,5-dioxovalerate dehydrogenase n=1 Tax=Sphingomonas guangdongensis TaxID=1141890 RepID=A0A285R108_9SPHN|nr:aldehyde dehydrogenase (NADP(+)) [Sphingomonas guangdongensis]SOB87399.1 NADP-dependent aldehyde dehydrogenase [Sphingomonas guangdongensis]
MTLTGELFIGAERLARGEQFQAADPATGALIEDVSFSVATVEDVAAACAAAEAAFPIYSQLPLEQRATFLEAVADEIEALGDALTERASRESGLPAARLNGERGRTAGQFRLFAREVRDGGWQQLRIDRADPARTPPKPDLRLRTVPLGPVAVFGASNFPLAFSAAGGDTASALAAGCTVVVKGHPAHPGTSELVASAVLRAVERTGMPAGVFSLLNGTSNELGGALVRDPRITAVGFTGSRGGGTALMKIAAERPVPIPVYAEMSSINPVILMPAALSARGSAIAKGYVGSLTLGAGQFCTNPGLVLGIDGPDLDAFLSEAGAALSGLPAQVMLTAGIHRAYEEGRARLAGSAEVTTVGEGQPADGPTHGRAAIFSITGADFLADPAHAHEVFGSTSLVVRCADADELAQVLAKLEGQLTATLQIDEGDYADAARLVPVLERVAGRVIANDWPTGVEVTHAMVHGGPYPATSDGRSTSVGSLAIDRFLRPVSYQSLPEALLPAVLRDGGAGAAPVRVDGKRG